MPITLKTHKKLWGSAANRCAFPGCVKPLIEDTVDKNDYFAIGDEAHIISGSPSGPRFQKDFPLEQVDKYDNLLLLCKNHHATIDKDEKLYTIAKLRKIKQDHECWVRENLNINYAELQDDEIWAGYIDTIGELADFEHWLEWTGKLLGGRNTGMTELHFKQLKSLHKYLKGRIYPQTRKKLNKAIQQFLEVLEDFLNEFDLFNDYGEAEPGHYITQRLYLKQIITGSEQEVHEYTLESLIFHLTSAANYLCDQVRTTIARSYRLEEGILLLKADPIHGIAYNVKVYNARQKYPGVQKVKEQLKKRFRLKD